MICGTASFGDALFKEHPSDDEFLHDVIISEASPMHYALAADGLSANIARLMGVGVPWSAGDLMDFWEMYCKVHETLTRSGQRGERIEGEVLRGKVCDLLRIGRSMTVVAHLLDLPWQTIIESMTNGVPAVVWSWDETQWLDAEAIIHGSFETHSGERLAAMLGVHHCVIDKLAEWYGVVVNVKGQAHRDLLRSTLLRGLHPLDAREYLATLGVTVTDGAMYMQRQRMIVSGEVCSVMPKRQGKICAA